MKRFWGFIMLISMSAQAQLHEIGFSGGSATLISDIGQDDYLIPEGYFISGLYRRNTNEWISFTFRFSYGTMSDDDALSESAGRRLRAWRSDITVIGGDIMLEYNFLPLNPYKYPHGVWVTPYLGIGAGYHTSFISAYSPSTAGISDIQNTFYLPMAFGIKFSFRNRMKIIWELGPRYSFSDNMEGSLRLDNSSGPLSDRRGNDWYIYNGLSVTFGWGKLPCYLNTF